MTRRRRRLRSALLVRAGLLAVLLGACSPGEGATPVDAAPPAGPPVLFDREGIPGPWWRRSATEAMFHEEHRACLASAREARQRAGEDAAADAAYRRFLDCMQQRSWKRGLPPRS